MTEKFQSTDSFVEKLNALKIYSYFAEVTEFEKLIQEYEPTDHVIDYKNDASEFLKDHPGTDKEHETGFQKFRVYLQVHAWRFFKARA